MATNLKVENVPTGTLAYSLGVDSDGLMRKEVPPTGLGGLTSTSTGQPLVAGYTPLGAAAKGIKGFVFPEDFLEAGETDYSDAIDRATAYGWPLGYALVFSHGDYVIVRPIPLADEQHIIIMPGATLEAHLTSFVGSALITAGDNANPFASERWSVSGGGEMQCNNVIDYGIYVEWGAFARIQNLRIKGANTSGVFVGQTGTSYASIEIDLLNVWVFLNNVANTSSSIGIHINNATDCHLDVCYVIGYRTSIRTEAACGSIDLTDCHVWNRSVHGPLLRCFDIQGKGNTLSQCYADTPTVYNNGGAMASDAYGFYLHGFNPVLTSCRVFMNTAQVPDTSNDNTVTAVYMDREVFGAINGIIIDGGTSGTKRYKSFFSGSTGGTTFKDMLSGGSNFVVDTASNITVQTAQLGISAYFRSAAIHTAYNRFQDRLRAEGSLGIEILQNASSNSDLVLQRGDGTAAFIVRKDSGGNFAIARRDSGGAAVDTPLTISNSTGIIAMATLQASTSYANDAAAAVGGVPVGGLYRNGSVVQIRIT